MLSVRAVYQLAACPLFTCDKVLARPYRELPEAEYYARLHQIQPELSKLAASLDDQSAVLRQEMTTLVGELVAGAFGAPR
jgi:hypothetical protein